jgi:hypothetical protein
MDTEQKERLRCLKLRDLRTLYRRRYGPTLPEDDAGLDDLRLLLEVHSLRQRDAAQFMANEIEVIAPWLPPEAASGLVDSILRQPVYNRAKTGRQIGDAVRLTNAERWTLKLWRLKPFDMTDAECVDYSKFRAKQRIRRNRRAKGIKPRADYDAERKARPKPWLELGISRAKYYRTVRLGVSREHNGPLVVVTYDVSRRDKTLTGVYRVTPH